MKLILREYLAALRERQELDALLPDLLSEMGLNVYSRPGRGASQHGVDVAAVGKLDEKKQQVHLFTVKPGNLTRSDWAKQEPADLRPSINEILDAYIPARIPVEHRDKDIIIYVCIGGDVDEQVLTQVNGFLESKQTSSQMKGQTVNINLKLWNGDRLAALIQNYLFSENLFPSKVRSLLRKSLAMLDSPDTAYKYFAQLLNTLMPKTHTKNKQRLQALRQISLCVWILLAWGRDNNNLEAPYRCSELALLYGWEIIKGHATKRSKTSRDFQATYASIFRAHDVVSDEFLGKTAFAHATTQDGLSSAVQSTNSLDVNLKLFELLGRTAMKGIWLWWKGKQTNDKEVSEIARQQCHQCIHTLQTMINNNPILSSPIRDDQGIELFLAIALISIEPGNTDFINDWLTEIVNRCVFAYHTHSNYPCCLFSYTDLLHHAEQADDEYRLQVTNASILYPVIALFAQLCGVQEANKTLGHFQQSDLSHCNCQYWYPDETSEAHFYTNNEIHGSAFSGIKLEQSAEQLLKEAENSNHFYGLSAVKAGMWPLILVACRHYRLPPPIHSLVFFATEEIDKVGAD